MEESPQRLVTVAVEPKGRDGMRAESTLDSDATSDVASHNRSDGPKKSATVAFRSLTPKAGPKP